jgi:hypothetical protein
VFSGRPDPTWTVPDEVGEDLADWWLRLRPAGGRPADLGPVLGYRGVVLRDPHGSEWSAFSGVVSCSAPGSLDRADPDRAWERAVLRTAPPDTVPLGLGFG